MAADKKKTTTTTRKRKPKAKSKTEIAEIEISAPVIQHTDGRPSLAEARGILKEGMKAAKHAHAYPGQVMNQEPGLVYYYWDALSVEDDRIERLRLMFGQKGYWKVSGDEYVPGVPHAEIWATYSEIHSELQKASKKRWEEKKRSLLGGS